jgi:hypothetical protein
LTGDNYWRAISDRPAPRFDAATLTVWLNMVGDPTEIIRETGAPFPAPRWCEAGLVQLFGLDAAHHCFHSTPHIWTRFHEPQITGGLAHFLTDGPPAQCRARAIAFVTAAAQVAGKPVASYQHVHSAFAIAEENRTDLLITLYGDGKPTGASIEAKFGHRLTRGQLPKAYKHVEEVLQWDMDTAVLLVVAPEAPGLPEKGKDKGWRSTSWWSLLNAFETCLAPSFDDGDFRRFRRTIWSRAYEE